MNYKYEEQKKTKKERKTQGKPNLFYRVYCF